MNTLIRKLVAQIHAELAEQDKGLDWLSEESRISKRKLKQYLTGDSDIPIKDVASIAWALDMDCNVAIGSLEPIEEGEHIVWENLEPISGDNFTLAA